MLNTAYTFFYTNVAGFDSRTRRHMWIEFIVGSRPCCEGFSPGTPVFPSHQKPTFPNFDLIRNLRATGLSVNLFFHLFWSAFLYEDKPFRCSPSEHKSMRLTSVDSSFQCDLVSVGNKKGNVF